MCSTYVTMESILGETTVVSGAFTWSEKLTRYTEPQKKRRNKLQNHRQLF